MKKRVSYQKALRGSIDKRRGVEVESAAEDAAEPADAEAREKKKPTARGDHHA